MPRVSKLESVLRRANLLDSYLQLASGYVRRLEVNTCKAEAAEAIRYYRSDPKCRVGHAPAHGLEDRWYTSLNRGRPDYSVYGDVAFVSEMWACWSVYSKPLLLLLSKPMLVMGNSVTSWCKDALRVADLGNGFGFTTAGLKELWPRAKVWGTNLPDTWQYAVASEVGKSKGFSMLASLDRRVDLILASEYFEHFQRPMDHLSDVLDAGDPRWIVIANSFGSRSIGHFDEYLQPDGVAVSNKVVGRRWNALLRSRGYQALKTRFWNNRPTVWERQ